MEASNSRVAFALEEASLFKIKASSTLGDKKSMLVMFAKT